MKKLAARDFEDLLQVRIPARPLIQPILILYSVQFPHSRVC
jgi:hypothetical protein